MLRRPPAKALCAADRDFACGAQQSSKGLLSFISNTHFHIIQAQLHQMMDEEITPTGCSWWSYFKYGRCPQNKEARERGGLWQE